jgi:hypothetical protein
LTWLFFILKLKDATNGLFVALSKLKTEISKNGCADNEGVLSDKIERFVLPPRH